MSNLDIAGYCRQGKVFGAANVSAKSVIAVTTAMTGLIIYNPPQSGKRVVLVDAGFVWTTAPAAVHNLGIAIAKPNATAPSSLTAAGSPTQALDGTGVSGTSVVQAYDAATLPVAPVAVRWFGGANTGVGAYYMIDHIDGGIQLVPGAVACLTVVTTTAVGMGSFSWIEVPA